MKNTIRIISALAILTFADSCAVLQQFLQNGRKNHDTPVDYLERAPKIDIKNFFNGELESAAIIQDINGRIQDSFIAKVNGKWEENRGTVQYNYTYNNGKKDSRTWLITVNDATSYTAIGHDFIETAQGRNQGNGSIVNYTMNALFEDVKQKIDFEDQLYLIDEKSAIIISDMKKDGSQVARAIISLKKN